MREARRGTCRRPNLRERHCRPGQCPPRPISSGWFALPRGWTLRQRPRHGDAITRISGRVACGTGALAAGSRGLPAGMADKRQREAPLVRPNRRGQARRRGSVNTFQFSSISRNPRAATRTRRSRCSLAWARFVVADKGGVPGGVGAGALTYGAPGRGPVSVCFRRKKQTRNAQPEHFS